MYGALLTTHSFLRYLVLLLLIAVIIKSFAGFAGKKSFDKADNILGLTLFSVTHTQFLIGFILYFVSPLIKFSGAGMKDPTTRYWTAEHFVIMIAAVVLITVARLTSKRMTVDNARHKRMLIFNSIALVLIVGAITMSKRGLL